MKEAEVKRRAFAMPLTSPAYPIGPYRFVNREFLIITYRTDPAKLRELVPEPLQIDEPLVKFEFIRMPDSTGFGDYTESGQVIPVSLQRPQGQLHPLHVPQRPSADRRRPRAVGLSQEARQADPQAEIDTLVGTLHYGPIAHRDRHHGLQAQGRRPRRRQGVAARRRISCSRSCRMSTARARICELVEYSSAGRRSERRLDRPAALNLTSHALAPLAELPVLEIVSGTAHRRRPHARSRQGRARLSGVRETPFFWKWRLPCV